MMYENVAGWGDFLLSEGRRSNRSDSSRGHTVNFKETHSRPLKKLNLNPSSEVEEEAEDDDLCSDSGVSVESDMSSGRLINFPLMRRRHCNYQDLSSPPFGSQQMVQLAPQARQQAPLKGHVQALLQAKRQAQQQAQQQAQLQFQQARQQAPLKGHVQARQQAPLKGHVQALLQALLQAPLQAPLQAQLQVQQAQLQAQQAQLEAQQAQLEAQHAQLQAQQAQLQAQQAQLEALLGEARSGSVHGGPVSADGPTGGPADDDV